MSVLFSLHQVSKAYGDDTLFYDLTFDFKSKEQLGLIGMNGSGKIHPAQNRPGAGCPGHRGVNSPAEGSVCLSCPGRQV